MEILKHLKKIRNENSRPRLVYFFQNGSMSEVVRVASNIGRAANSINEGQQSALISASLGNLDAVPVIYVTPASEANNNVLFGQALQTLFREAGTPKYVFGASQLDALNEALIPFGKTAQKDKDWVGDVKQVINIE